MTKLSTGKYQGWRTVLEHFERHILIKITDRVALNLAFSADWGADVFEAYRRYQCSRGLLFSTIVELMTRAALGLRPSLHEPAQQMEYLPVSVTALYDKVDRTEPDILRALVHGCTGRLTSVMAGLSGAVTSP